MSCDCSAKIVVGILLVVSIVLLCLYVLFYDELTPIFPAPITFTVLGIGSLMGFVLLARVLMYKENDEPILGQDESKFELMKAGLTKRADSGVEYAKEHLAKVKAMEKFNTRLIEMEGYKKNNGLDPNGMCNDPKYNELWQSIHGCDAEKTLEK
jgi:uncharacterized membrane protein